MRKMEKGMFKVGQSTYQTIGHNEIKVVIAGGGTGGHLFPGLAVAREISRRYEKANIVFVIGRRKMESDILTSSGFRQEMINVEGLKGRGWKEWIMALLKLPYCFFQSVSILNKFSPNLVLGVGGYSAGPVCLAARFMGTPTAIQEQNSFPGFTNRLLCRIVDRVFISFEESREYFPAGALYLTGNPIRGSLLVEENDPKKAGDKFTILVVGGSQGARAINKSFVEALGILQAEGKEPRVVHQVGETDYNRVKEEYGHQGLEGDIIPFIHDMAGAYNSADIVVSRAGATTIAELAFLGKPSILIPYPYSANRHQELNARMLHRVGGAEMILQKNLDGQGLADLLMKYMSDRTALNKMGAMAQGVGRPNAVQIIVDQLTEMIKRN